MNTPQESFPVAPNAVYVWRGFRSPALDYEHFVQFLGSVFVPACVLLQPPVGLRAYLPTMMPQAGKPPAVPDQTALMFWATPASHDRATKAIAARIYQNLHGDVYDMARSKLPEVPVALDPHADALVAEQPYFLIDRAADWMLGSAKHFVGARRANLRAADFLAAAHVWATSFQAEPPDGVDGALVCCGDDYVAAWIHSTYPQPRPCPALDQLAALTTPVLRMAPRPLALPAGLWDDWPGLDLARDACINLQFSRPRTSRTAPREPEA
ncbi:hypothetical protein [Burkholderia thailandensis]|uniref:DUF3025 domain-containing protein n=2 Tax=Burkholderia thailandensis TaxID=57975 RepID=A0AAW9CTB6_BURTH|nr:hypothetical protein [Burkholderia thailandensis]ABC34308.1 conserved hypothetical protein [Burkholderia thailandensis E264]AHI67968.1 hypothetical protein BTL_5498 [Burkholderia thailandensis H0587]AHI76729.1 hypothetical protein BTQ_3678 [Burkholderia thailandensis 2002721723]AHI81759.1 hypothetical protein BTJ_4711 [Burkholderia thailandensis E444]AIC90342.1 hypothetical protein BTRA_5437 [Burkholderia thailandensis USAMRU Malaysia \